jgi:hypothetical protein
VGLRGAIVARRPGFVPWNLAVNDARIVRSGRRQEAKSQGVHIIDVLEVVDSGVDPDVMRCTVVAATTA